MKKTKKARKVEPGTKYLDVSEIKQQAKDWDLQTRTLVHEWEHLTEQAEAMKAVYQRLDELILLLKDRDLSGYGITVVDNFKTKNTVFKLAAVKRFELKKTL